MIERVAFIAMHTSPLLQPGTGDAGGMNIYLDRLARKLASRGIEITTFTRRADGDVDAVVPVVDGYKVVHIDAGEPVPLRIGEMKHLVGDFSDGVVEWIRANDVDFDLVHTHYWLSGIAGMRVKREFGIPMANSFHTLGKVKDRMRSASEKPSSAVRLEREQEVIRGSDCVIASTPYEFDDLLAHYGASPERLCVSPPGVDHDVFRPGDRWLARERLGLSGDPMVLYAGRIQPHKGTALAVEAFTVMEASMDDEFGNPFMYVIGGASGDQGREEMQRATDHAERAGLSDRVTFLGPVPHAILADYYRAADVVIIPSRSESFGLVAAEAQACGTPVVAANTGGLPYVIKPSESGLLVEDHDPRTYARAMQAIVEHHRFADRLGEAAVEQAKRFSWSATADRLMELYQGIVA